jgi:thioredoxin reductase (NADPH)
MVERDGGGTGETVRGEGALMTERHLDIAVVGGGPCGIAVGAAARRAGLDVALFDRGPLCSTIVDYPPYVSFFSTPEKLEIEGLPFVTRERNPTRREALAYYRGVVRYFAIDVHLYHEVTGLERTGGKFRLRVRTPEEREEVWTARAAVVASGGFDHPNYLGIPGENLPKVSHVYREAHPYWNQDVIVIGAGNSAVEAALELFRVGARVTIVHFKSDFDPGIKAWVIPDIRNRVEQREVAVLWGRRVVEIRPGVVRVREEASGRTEEIRNDWVLALTGWRPDTTLLESAGVAVDAATGVPAHDSATMETPISGLYVAGVLVAGLDANRIFIENGRAHGRLIVDHVRATG